ncbi:MAG: transposase [Anaerolineae bacterium]
MEHIVARALAFVQSLLGLAQRTDRQWRMCPHCRSHHVHGNGTYTRRPWTLEGRLTLAVQRYECQSCGGSYSQEHPEYPPKCWYARSVRRYAIDQWCFLGSSLRRVAEWVRSTINKDGRWRMWYPLSRPDPHAPKCTLHHSTVQRWLDQAGQRAEKGVAGMYAGLPPTTLAAADGLWARLRGGATRVLLMLRDSVTGLLWPPVVAVGEEAAVNWAKLYGQAQRAGLELEELRAVVSDGAQGLLSHLRQNLPHVYQQRCVFHTWRNLSRELARQAALGAQGLAGQAVQEARERVGGELTGLVHGVLDASTSEEALEKLQAHPQGQGLWKVLNARFIHLLTHTMAGHEGLGRVTSEWMWRDFRLRLSRGRNHGDEERLQRAGLLFTSFRNFTPAQMRQERARRYRHPGKSALEVAGLNLEGCSYLDALEV